MNLFDILGPVMVGPSSSHTAGAVRIGLIARKLLGQAPKWAEIKLHGSFATTGKGHGTDKALIAGLLGLSPADPRIPESFELADIYDLHFTFGTCQLRDVHPNSVLMQIRSTEGAVLEIGASSLGGGRIKVFLLDGLNTSFGGELPTLIIHNTDRPGCVSQVTEILAQYDLNIASLQLNRGGRGGRAVMVIECDQPIADETANKIQALPGILHVSRYTPEDEEEFV